MCKGLSHSSQLTDETGISFLELVVALFVIALMVPTLTHIQATSVKLTADAGARDTAWAAVRAKAEELMAADGASIVAGKDEFTLPDGSTLARVWTLTNDKPVKGSLTIHVSVATDALKGSRKPVAMTFVKSQ